MEYKGKIVHFGKQSESKVGRPQRYSDEIVISVIDMRLIQGLTWARVFEWLQTKVEDGTIKSVPRRKTMFGWIKQYCEQTGASPSCINITHEQEKTFEQHLKNVRVFNYRPNARVRRFLEAGDKKSISSTLNTIVEWYIDQLVTQGLYTDGK